jgi:hypothetical protein
MLCNYDAASALGTGWNKGGRLQGHDERGPVLKDDSRCGLRIHDDGERNEVARQLLSSWLTISMKSARQSRLLCSALQLKRMS